jgi:hypothetical protein
MSRTLIITFRDLGVMYLGELFGLDQVVAGLHFTRILTLGSTIKVSGPERPLGFRQGSLGH